MIVTAGNTQFDNVDYDAEADVLYLHVGDPATAVEFEESPEGHGLRFDGSGHLAGITIVGARELLGRDHRLVVTIPERLEFDPASLADIIDVA